MYKQYIQETYNEYYNCSLHEILEFREFQNIMQRFVGIYFNMFDFIHLLFTSIIFSRNTKSSVIQAILHTILNVTSNVIYQKQVYIIYYTTKIHIKQ